MRVREAPLVLRLAGWSLALPLLKRSVPLPVLVRLMVRSGRRSQVRDGELAERLTTLVRRVLSVRGGDPNCLERALLLYRYLPGAGLEPHLVVGFKPGDGTPVGHAWVVVDGKPFGEDADLAAEYGTSLWFGPDGLRRQASALGAAEP